MEQQIEAIVPARKKSNLPIVIIGIPLLIGVAFLTFFAVRAVVNKINQNADRLNADTRNWFLRQQAQAAPVPEPEKDTSVRVTGYSSEDLVEIEGEWYLISNLAVESDEISSIPPIIVDTSDIVTVDGDEYMHILNPESIAGAGSDGIPPYGNEYVVVDIDGNMVYLVAKGDTLSQVSGRVGYSVQELAEFNQIRNVNLIYEGQTLRVPATEESIAYVQAYGGAVPKDDSDKDTAKSEKSSAKPASDAVSQTDAGKKTEDVSEPASEAEDASEEVSEEATEAESKSSSKIGIK